MDGNLEWGLGLDSGGQLCHPLLNLSRREKRGEGGRGLAHESSRVLHTDAYSVRVQTAWGIHASPERVSLAWPAGLLSLSSVPSL